MAALILVLCALIGFMIAIAIGVVIAPVFGFPDMEGSSAIFAVLIAGPIGAVAGAVIGKSLLNRFPDLAGRRKVINVILSVVGVFVLGNVLFSFMLLRDQLSQSASKIGYEIRLPAGMKAPPRKEDVDIRLRSAKDHGKAQMYDSLWLRDDNGRAVIRGYVEMFHVSKERAIVMRIGDGQTQVFKLRMAARPKSDPGFYGEWHAVTEIHDNDGSAPRPPGPGEIFEIRYFVTVPD